MRLAQQRALAAAQQLERLIDALLALARCEQIAEHREPTDLAAVAERLLQTRAGEIERQELRARVTLHHTRAHANQQLIERVVANLLDNAIAHNIPGGWLEVSSETLSGSAVLTIANSGATIPPTDLERIQQPFQRLGH